jgi:hypothetical protein
MNRRDLFKLAGGGVAAFLVGKYGPPAGVQVRWGTFKPTHPAVWVANTSDYPIDVRITVGPSALLKSS